MQLHNAESVIKKTGVRGTLSRVTPLCNSHSYLPAGFIFFLLSIMRCILSGILRLLLATAVLVLPMPAGGP